MFVELNCLSFSFLILWLNLQILKLYKSVDKFFSTYLKNKKKKFKFNFQLLKTAEKITRKVLFNCLILTILLLKLSFKMILLSISLSQEPSTDF